MNTVTIPLPDSITEAEARQMLALRLFEAQRISCGKAAEMAGLSKRDFMKLLGEHGIPVVNYPPEELASDVEHAARAHRH